MPGLDGLRAVAVLAVIGFHTQSLTGHHVIDGGFLGVDVFFVLSGFLITALLLGEVRDTGRIAIGGFYRRRAVRLLPALFLLLAVHVAYAAATGLPMDHEWATVRDAVLYVSNWSWAWAPLEGAAGLGHLWSLAVEEQFYLVWPAVVIVVRAVDRSGRLLLGVTVAGIVGAALWRSTLYDAGDQLFYLYQRTDVRVDALLVGSLVAQGWTRGWRMPPVPRLHGWALAGAIAVPFLTVSAGNAHLYSVGFTAFAVVVGGLVLVVVDGRWAGVGVLASRPFVAVGRLSYGLYLWHYPVLDVVFRYGDGWGQPLQVAVAWAASAACAVISWRLVERPAMRWRTGRRRPALPVDGGATTSGPGPSGASIPSAESAPPATPEGRDAGGPTITVTGVVSASGTAAAGPTRTPRGPR